MLIPALKSACGRQTETSVASALCNIADIRTMAAEEYGVFSAVDVEEHFRRLKGCVDVNMQHAAWNANLDKRGVRAYTTDGRTHFGGPL